MLNLTMGQLELPAPQESHGPTDDSDEDDNSLEDMFQVPTETLVFWAPLPAKPRLDPWALMAEAKLKSGWQTLPLPPCVRRHIDDPDSDTQNVVLRALQMPKVTDTQVEVTNPQNTDPLYLDRDANRDKALQVMQDRHRRESRSSSADPAQAAESDTGVVPGREMRLTPRREDRHPWRTGPHQALWPPVRCTL